MNCKRIEICLLLYTAAIRRNLQKIKKMKEFVITFNLLAEDNEEAKKLSESICKYFLSDNLCTVDSIRLKYPNPKSNKSKRDSDKSWLKTFGYSDG